MDGRTQHRVSHPLRVAVLVLGALAVLLFVWARPLSAKSNATLPSNVVVEKRVFDITNGQVKSLTAACPKGTRIFSGGYASTGLHTRVFVAGPSRGENGYIVSAVTPPVSINTAVTRETAHVTVVAWCAKIGEPIVLGAA